MDAHAHQIQQRNQRDRRQHLVDVVERADREEQRGRPLLRADHEGDVQHHEAVDQLRYRGGAGGAQPRMAFAGARADAVEHLHVDQLADQEGNQRADDDPHALAENRGERGLVIRHALVLGHADPPRCWRQVDREIGEHEAVHDQARGQPADHAHAALAEILVDRVGHDEHDRPQDRAGGEVQRPGLAEQVPFQRRDAEGVFQREDLDSDELGKHCVGAEEGCQRDEQPGGAVIEEAERGSGGVGVHAPKFSRADAREAAQSCGCGRITSLPIAWRSSRASSASEARASG